jgi:hypothetical protein
MAIARVTQRSSCPRRRGRGITRCAVLVLAGCLAAAPATPAVSAQGGVRLGPVPLEVPFFVHPAAPNAQTTHILASAPTDSARGTQWLGAGMAFGLAFASLGLFTGAMACEGGFANQQCIHHIALGGLIGGAVGFALGAFVGSFIPKPARSTP